MACPSREGGVLLWRARVLVLRVPFSENIPTYSNDLANPSQFNHCLIALHWQATMNDVVEVPGEANPLTAQNLLTSLAAAASSVQQQVQIAAQTQNRMMYESNQRKLQEILSSRKAIESLITLSKGNREWISLIDQCFEIRLNEKVFKGGSFEGVPRDFTFRLCPFVNVTQRETPLKPKAKSVDEKEDEDSVTPHFLYLLILSASHEKDPLPEN